MDRASTSVVLASLLVACSATSTSSVEAGPAARTCGEAVSALTASSFSCTTDCVTTIACVPWDGVCGWDVPHSCAAGQVFCNRDGRLEVYRSGLACADSGPPPVDAGRADSSCADGAIGAGLTDGGVARSCCDVYAALAPWQATCPTYCPTTIACDPATVSRCELAPFDSCNARWAWCGSGIITVYTSGLACPPDAGPDT